MSKSKLIQPHGAKELKILLLEGKVREEELKRARSLPKVTMTSREVGDLIMLGIGGFTPLDGFMGRDDWKGVCADMKMKSGLFWPIPITRNAAGRTSPLCNFAIRCIAATNFWPRSPWKSWMASTFISWSAS